MCDVSDQESLLETHLRVLQGLVAGSLCLAFARILDLQRESRCLFSINHIVWDFPGGAVVKTPSVMRENLWVGEIASRKKWQPIPVFLPGEFC